MTTTPLLSLTPLSRVSLPTHEFYSHSFIIEQSPDSHLLFAYLFILQHFSMKFSNTFLIHRSSPIEAILLHIPNFSISS